MKTIDIKINAKRHLAIWALVTTYLCLLDPVQGGLRIQIPVTFLIMTSYMFVFYSLSLLILPRFWKRNFLLLIPCVIVLGIIYGTINYLNFSHLLPFLGGDTTYKDTPYVEALLNSLNTFPLTMIPAAAYFSNNVSIKKLEESNEKEKLLLVKELNFLKNQFNSHITFNFLNYCYSKVHQFSEETAEAIELFSSMLRYSLGIQPQEKVLLLKEIEYIRNFIALQKLLTSEVYVNFKCDSSLERKLILPRILITFVENAFKHGQFNNSFYPIEISLTSSDNNGIFFKVTNRKVMNIHLSSRKNMINTGVGQENVIQILNLFYGREHNLSIQDDEENYNCELFLKLT